MLHLMCVSGMLECYRFQGIIHFLYPTHVVLGQLNISVAAKIGYALVRQYKIGMNPLSACEQVSSYADMDHRIP